MSKDLAICNKYQSHNFQLRLIFFPVRICSSSVFKAQHGYPREVRFQDQTIFGFSPQILPYQLIRFIGFCRFLNIPLQYLTLRRRPDPSIRNWSFYFESESGAQILCISGQMKSRRLLIDYHFLDVVKLLERIPKGKHEDACVVASLDM